MIRISKLVVAHFRGIRTITLDMGGKNFAVCGPNGSGKSGIVDAIEFVLTGNISRLAGKGTGGLSVKEHGPHVDSTPEEAFVEAEVHLSNPAGKATIRRTVKQPKAPTITPDTPAVRAALADLAAHPEFVLSRREIIKFVLAEPSMRSELVQSLLRLDELDDVRAVLTRIANAEERVAKQATRSETDAGADLARAVGIPTLGAASLLTAVNGRRATLGLEPIMELTPTTSLREGLSAGTGVGAVTISKAKVLTELKAAREALQQLGGSPFKQAVEAAYTAVVELELDVELLQGANRESMLQIALGLFDETCPVCSTAFDAETFQKVVNAKLEALAAATQRRQALEKQLDPLADVLDRTAQALKLAAAWGQIGATPIDTSTLVSAASVKIAAAGALRRILPIGATKEALKDAGDVGVLSEILDKLDQAAALLPEPTGQEAARDVLTLAQAKLDQARACRAAAATAKARAALAAAASSTFGDALTAALDGIFEKVRGRFRDFYRAINHDDEMAFEARFKQEPGRLALDVDFYGRGFFPPAAYHSEGHQDGMGLCLYLALTDYLLGKNFSIAVLDDVLMSVDAGHRREFSRLLKSEFPHTQFVLTTHDPIWLKHMATEGLIEPKACAHFRKWSVEHGPAQWDNKDVWADIDGLLDVGNVNGAAAALRRFLEYFGEESCHRLRARVEFRADADFMLGDTLPQSVAALSDLLKKGRVAAGKWKKAERVAELQALENSLASARQSSDVDNWQINKAVHYNTWENLKKEDFEPVVAAYKALLSHFHCPDCAGALRVSPERGRKEALRCSCGTIQISLVEP